MAVLYVAEFVSVGGSSNFNVSGALVPALTEQTVVIGGSSTQCTNFFDTKTKFVRIHCDAICSIKFGTNPTAATTNMRLAANQTEYFPVPEGGGYKVAVISNT